jgi:5-hydroxyisourate hydrolase
MGRLTTHVLDTANGCPGAGILVELFRTKSPEQPIASAITNSDGRCDSAMLEGKDFEVGEYELLFHAGNYFDARGEQNCEEKFLDRIVIRFGISDPDGHYHVPLLLSPFAYTTYRGS